jgi:hypothetical protein
MWCVVDFPLHQRGTQSLNLGDEQRNPARRINSIRASLQHFKINGTDHVSRGVQHTDLPVAWVLCGRIDFCYRTSHANEECLDTAGAAVSLVARVIRQF